MLPAFTRAGKLLGAGVPVLNVAHPLAQGLVAAYCPGAFPNVPIVNLASPGSGDLVTNGGGAFLGSTPEGLGLALSGTATNLFARAVAPPQMQPAGFLSAFVRGQWTGTTGVDIPGSIFSVTYTTTAPSVPFWSFVIGATPANTPVQRPGGGFAIGSGTFRYGTYANPALGVNQMTSLGLVLPAGPTGATAISRFYQDGIPYPDTEASPSYNFGFYGATPWVVLGDPSARARTAAFTVTVAYMWNRAITDGAMRELDANPCALLHWPSDLVSIALATLASGTLITANWSLGAEFLAAVQKNDGPQAEALALLLRDGNSPFEAVSSVVTAPVTADARMALEFLGGVRRGFGAGLAAVAPKIIRRFSRPGLISRVRRRFLEGQPARSGSMVFENIAGQRADLASPQENLATSRVDKPSPAETQALIRGDTPAVVEEIGTIETAITGDAHLPLEILTGVQRDD